MVDLATLGTTATAQEIQDTAVTQPLVVALSLIAFGELRRRVELPSGTPVAGHSVGELAAAAMAGVFSPDDAVALAAVRGREMAAACALEPTGMAAVMGGDPAEVISWLAEFDLVGANVNGAGQIASFFISVVFGYFVQIFHSYDAPLIPMAILVACGALIWLKIDPTREIAAGP